VIRHAVDEARLLELAPAGEEGDEVLISERRAEQENQHGAQWYHAAMRYAIVALLLACAARQPAAVTSCRCRPGEPCWPSAAEWQQLGAGLHGKLEQPAAPKLSNNPYALQEQSGATQSQG